MVAKIVLKEGREKSLRARHPWVFSGALAREDADIPPGAVVRVLDSHGQFLAWAAYSPSSQIRARVWSFQEQTVIDASFLLARLQAALQARAYQAPAVTGMRLVQGESDGLPGLVIDVYQRVAVVQILATGMEIWRDWLWETLPTLLDVEAIVERSEAEVRTLEGLPPRHGLVWGVLPAEVLIQEQGISYAVDVLRGQKTGFYLDQRDNRARIMALAAGRRVLNCCCYTGGFSLAAWAGGATEVLSVDSSADALQAAQANAVRNGWGTAAALHWVEADMFQYLRKLRDQGRQFDLIILDPPKFAPTAAHVAKAARAYKDINLWACKLLAPGGYLATFSCSGGMTQELFRKIVAGAAVDAHTQAQIVAQLQAAADHPIGLHFPEGEYLRGLLLRKL